MIHIKTGELEQAVYLSKKIPELENPYSIEEYTRRLTSSHLILAAYVDNQPAGFKVGYDRFNNGGFYSWMGGVLPNFRRMGVASALADFQEKWAKKNGYTFITLKTRNKHHAMIELSLKRGFVIVNKILKIPETESRIIMEKKLA